jgi:hypothetical protein
VSLIVQFDNYSGFRHSYVFLLTLTFRVRVFPLLKVTHKNIKYIKVNRSRSGKVYSIQHYVIKFDSDLRQVGGFLRIFQFPTPRYNWNIAENDVKHHNQMHTITHELKTISLVLSERKDAVFFLKYNNCWANVHL